MSEATLPTKLADIWAFYAYFDTKELRLAFLDRLNAWLRANWSKAYA